MKNESEITAQTPEEKIAQIARLMAEAEAMLVEPATAGADETFRSLTERLGDLQSRVSEVYGKARRRLVRGAEATDVAIRTHPYEAVAIALGIGVLLGAVLRRDRD